VVNRRDSRFVFKAALDRLRSDRLRLEFLNFWAFIYFYLTQNVLPQSSEDSLQSQKNRCLDPEF